MRYDPATDHDPMFDVTPAQGGVGEVKARTRSIPSVARAKCPECASLRPTGIVRQGPHLAWRHHTRTLGSGARIECPSVGVPICQAPPTPTPGVTTPTCTCGEPA